MSPTREDVADLIRRFIEGSVSPYEWDDFTSVPSSDPEIEAARQACISVREEHPPSISREYCNGEGIQALKALARELRERAV